MGIYGTLSHFMTLVKKIFQKNELLGKEFALVFKFYVQDVDIGHGGMTTWGILRYFRGF